MSGVKRVVSTEFWNDRIVSDDFSPEDKYFYLYLLTNPHTTQLGIYELPISKASQEMGYTREAIKVLIDRFQNRYHMIKYSEISGEVAIKYYLRHSIVKGGKPVYDCLIKELGRVKDMSLVKFVYVGLVGKTDLNETVVSFLDFVKESNKEINDNDNDNDNDNERIVPRIANESYHESSLSSKRKANPNNVDNLNSLIDIEEFLPIKDNEELYLIIKDWMEYKDSKGKQHLHYAEKSLRTLLKTFIDNNNKYGVSALRSVVDYTIGQGYQGIVWDKLQTRRDVNAGNTTQSDWLKMWENA